MSKAIKQTLAAIGPRQAVAIGKEAPAKIPTGAVQLTFGKTYALQRQASNVVEALPGKLPAAVKALVESGGVVTSKVAKASGLDFAALVAKLEGNKNLTVTASANKVTVTPKARRADLIAVGQAAPAAPAKVAKAAPAKASAKAPVKVPAKADKKAKEAPKAAKATQSPAKGAKAASAAPKVAKGKAAKPAPKVEASKAKAKGPVKGKAVIKPAKVETKPAKGKGKGKPDKAPKARGKNTRPSKG